MKQLEACTQSLRRKPGAKKTVAGILAQFGWETAESLQPSRRHLILRRCGAASSPGAKPADLLGQTSVEWRRFSSGLSLPGRA